MRTWVVGVAWAFGGVAVGAAATYALVGEQPPALLSLVAAGSTPVAVRYAWPDAPGYSDLVLRPGDGYQACVPNTATPFEIRVWSADPLRDLRTVDVAELAAAKPVLAGWEPYVVAQRKVESGCIPTGYEFLLRSAGAKGIDFATFQDEFDLGLAVNNFTSVAEAVQKKYPHVAFGVRAFVTPEERLRFVEDALGRGQPVVVPVFLAPNTCHIVPVLGTSDNEVYVLWIVEPDGTKHLRAIRKWELARRDDEFSPDSPVAWLESPPR